MTAFLARRWFLLALVGGVGLACLQPEWLQPGTRLLEPRLVVALALFLLALGLESRDLLGTLTRPLPALWAVCLSYGLVPACGWLAGQLLPADLRVGVMIIASVPCTLASAVLWTRMAGGNQATAMLVVLLTTGTSWLVTTGWLYVSTNVALEIEPAGMMRDLALVLMLPVALGQLGRAAPLLVRAATRSRSVLDILSQLLILTIILRAAVDVSLRLRADAVPVAAGSLVAAAALCLWIHLTALAAGWWSSRALRFDRPGCIAVAFACSQKTLPVALLLFDAHYKDRYPLAVVPLVFYHVGQLIVDTFIVDGLLGNGKRSSRPSDISAVLHES